MRGPHVEMNTMKRLTTQSRNIAVSLQSTGETRVMNWQRDRDSRLEKRSALRSADRMDGKKREGGKGEVRTGATKADGKKMREGIQRLRAEASEEKEGRKMRCGGEGGEAGGQEGQRSRWANQYLRSPASSLQSQRFPAEKTLNKEKRSEKLGTEGKTLSHTD